MSQEAVLFAASKVGLSPRPDMLGNRLWVRRKQDCGGRPRHFKSPDEFMDAAVDYFEWCYDNPLYEEKLVQVCGVPVPMSVPKMRMMTTQALCLHIGISSTAWYEYRTREGFQHVWETIRDAIYVQKIEGAGAGLLDSNVIIREIGLRDRSDVTLLEPVTRITRTVIDAGE